MGFDSPLLFLWMRCWEVLCISPHSEEIACCRRGSDLCSCSRISTMWQKLLHWNQSVIFSWWHTCVLIHLLRLSSVVEQKCVAYKVYQEPPHLNSTQKDSEVHTSKLIHVSSTTAACLPSAMWDLSVCASVNCACGGAPSINQVRLEPAAERGPQWATQPVRRSGEIQCPQHFNALQMSLQPRDWGGDGEVECEAAVPWSRPRSASATGALNPCSARAAVHLQFWMFWLFSPLKT